MQINPRKTVWAAAEVDYLGFVITRDGPNHKRKKLKPFLKVKPHLHPKRLDKSWD